MNFKERISKINKVKTQAPQQMKAKSEIDVSDIFVKNTTVEHILRNAVLKSKNIVLMCQSNCDKTLISNYMRKFMGASASVAVLSDFSTGLPSASASTLIVPEPSIRDIVKIFELILCDYKSFIFTMNLKSFCNVLESLRTIVSLNKPQLAASNVEHLIGMSEALLVYVSRNEDGLFAVSDIGKIVYKNNKMFLDVLYGSSVEPLKIQESAPVVAPVQVRVSAPVSEPAAEPVLLQMSETTPEPTPESTPEPVPAPVIKKEKKDELVVEQSIEVLEQTSDENSDGVIVKEEAFERKPKVNKYKLLKDKIKSKKLKE